MSVTLIRRSDGGRLTIDAVPDAQIAPTWRVSEHPIEADAYELSSVVDHVQRMAGTVKLRCVVTERPDDPGDLGSGPDRVARVLAWLDAAGGELLDVAFPHRPTLRGYVLEAAPWAVRVAEDLPFELSLREVRFAESSSVGGVTAVNAKRPRADAVPASAAERDVGTTATKPADASLAKSISRMLFGG